MGSEGHFRRFLKQPQKRPRQLAGAFLYGRKRQAAELFASLAFSLRTISRQMVRSMVM